MPCYHPITAYRAASGKNPKTGKWPIVFDIKNGYKDMPVQIPCGRCIGCRLEKSRQWAIRCVHEASLYSDNCFITLTYDNEHLPSDLSLDKSHFVLFMKRLRKKYGDGIRFFHCGEYGELYKRPHHHACLFNFDFPDKKLWSTREGIPLYTSESLQKLWPYGYSTIGAVTFESAAYVARYVMKKITGDKAEAHYNGREPEYITMSRRPGIAREWFEKFKTDVYPQDFCIIRNNIKCKPPKYYDNLYDLTNSEDFRKIKLRRLKLASQSPNNTPDRLLVRERVKSLKVAKLKRTID